MIVSTAMYKIWGILHLCRWHWCSHVHSQHLQKWTPIQHDDHHLSQERIGLDNCFLRIWNTEHKHPEHFMHNSVIGITSYGLHLFALDLRVLSWLVIHATTWLFVCIEFSLIQINQSSNVIRRVFMHKKIHNFK